MPVRKVGARWLVDIRYKGRRYRIRSPGATRADAHAHELLLRSELATHGGLEYMARVTEHSRPVPTFSEFAAFWMDRYPRTRRNKPSEVASKRSILGAHLLPVFATKRLDEIRAIDVVDLTTRCSRRGLSPKTINNILTVLNCMLTSAEEWDVLTSRPKVRLQPVDRPDFRFLTDGEIAGLLRTTAPGVLRTAILLGLHAGLRWGEISALTWADVDLSRRQITVRRAFSRGSLETPKNRKTRHLPITDELARALDGLPERSGLVLLWHGRRLQEQTALRHLHAACTAASVEPCGYHVLRHTFASQLALRGVPLIVVRDLLGHSSIKMTERYAHLTPADASSVSALMTSAVGLLTQPLRLRGHSVGTPPLPDNPATFSASADSSASMRANQQEQGPRGPCV